MSDKNTWDSIKGESIETPKNLADFFNDIEAVCRKFNLSISHQDEHGAFMIEKFDEYNVKWLKNAHINYDTQSEDDEPR